MGKTSELTFSKTFYSPKVFILFHFSHWKCVLFLTFSERQWKGLDILNASQKKSIFSALGKTFRSLGSPSVSSCNTSVWIADSLEQTHSTKFCVRIEYWRIFPCPFFKVFVLQFGRFLVYW